MKALFQLLLLILIFFVAWLGFSQPDYVKIFHLKELSKSTEKKIGDEIVEVLKKTEQEAGADSAALVLTNIKNKLLYSNRNIPHDLQLHLIKSNEVNAFALPGNHIIVYTGLINQCDSPEELCGVLAHEMAHLSLNHVMKRLAGEIGITVLATVTTGNAQVINQVIKLLSSNAFERKQESEADAAAVTFLIHSHINPNAFAGFMDKIANLKKEQPGVMEWISTHPDSHARAETIRSLIGTTHQAYNPVINPEEWQLLKHAAGSSGQ